MVRTERGNRKLRQKKVKEKRKQDARAHQNATIHPADEQRWASTNCRTKFHVRHYFFVHRWESRTKYALSCFMVCNSNSRLIDTSYISFAINFVIVIDIFLNYNRIVYKVINIYNINKKKEMKKYRSKLSYYSYEQKKKIYIYIYIYI